MHCNEINILYFYKISIFHFVPNKYGEFNFLFIIAKHNLYTAIKMTVRGIINIHKLKNTVLESGN